MIEEDISKKLKKNFLTIPFFISIFFLNTGFIFKPKLNAFYCGSNMLLEKSNQNLLKQQSELFIFDNKGKSYQYDYSTNKVYPEKTKISSGVEFKLIKSYIEGSKFYVDYGVNVNSIPGSAEIILDFEKKYVTGFMYMAGMSQPIPRNNCKEIEFPKDTNFEY